MNCVGASGKSIPRDIVLKMFIRPEDNSDNKSTEKETCEAVEAILNEQTTAAITNEDKNSGKIKVCNIFILLILKYYFVAVDAVKLLKEPASSPIDEYESSVAGLKDFLLKLKVTRSNAAAYCHSLYHTFGVFDQLDVATYVIQEKVISLETDLHMKPIDCRKVREALPALLGGGEREAAAIKAAEEAAVD